jgi:Domain of unknown function (DUF4911)
VWTREEPVLHETKQNADAVDAFVERRVRVAPRDVVIIKGICEASEGLCAMFAERGGDLVLSAAPSRARELDELVADLGVDFGAIVDDLA